METCKPNNIPVYVMNFIICKDSASVMWIYVLQCQVSIDYNTNNGQRKALTYEFRAKMFREFLYI